MGHPIAYALILFFNFFFYLRFCPQYLKNRGPELPTSSRNKALKNKLWRSARTQSTNLTSQSSWATSWPPPTWPRRPPRSRSGSSWLSWPPAGHSLTWRSSASTRPRTTGGSSSSPLPPGTRRWSRSWEMRRKTAGSTMSRSFRFSCWAIWRNAWKFLSLLIGFQRRHFLPGMYQSITENMFW